jgi:hypothetical protein
MQCGTARWHAMRPAKQSEALARLRIESIKHFENLIRLQAALNAGD